MCLLVLVLLPCLSRPCPMYHQEGHLGINCSHSPHNMMTLSLGSPSVDFLDLAMADEGGLDSLGLATAISHWEPQVDITVSG